MLHGLRLHQLLQVQIPLLLASHATVVVGYAGIKLWQSIDAHCGMILPPPLSLWNSLPGMDCAGAHDYHHSHNVGNFGGFFMFWDWLCGTDAKFREFMRAGGYRLQEKSLLRSAVPLLSNMKSTR